MKYLMPKARNTVTNESIKMQDLNNYRYRLEQRAVAQYQADLLAQRLTQRTKVVWEGYVEEYTPSVRK